MNAEFGKRRFVRAAAATHAPLTEPAAGNENGKGESAAAAQNLRIALKAGAALLFFGLPVLLVLTGAFDFRPTPVLGKDGKPIALIPRELLPKPNDDLTNTIDLTERYPEDPRAHMFRGLYFLERKQLGDAERELRSALEHPELLNRDLPSYMEDMVRMTQTIILANRGKRPEAAAVAQPVCGRTQRIGGYLNTSYSQFRDMFDRTGVCTK